MVAETLLCLALNIYYEAGREPEEGKLAVAHVTMNRVNDPSFPQSVCGVVKQRTHRVEGEEKITICQFSWYCEPNKKIPPSNNPYWVDAKQIAKDVLEGKTDDPTKGALYFHATRVKPNWKHLKRVKQIGNHIFYSPYRKNKV